MSTAEKNDSLLDTLAHKIDCPYLSDLYNPLFRKKLVQALSAIAPEDFSLNEWTEAAGYILRTHVSYANQAQAKAHLLKRLSS